MNRLKIIGIAAATLAVTLLGAQSAVAAPASTVKAGSESGAGVAARQSCQVGMQQSCVTPWIWLNAGDTFHLVTGGIPDFAPWPAASSFIVLRTMTASSQPEVIRQLRWRGEEHDLWGAVGSAGYYRAELHCPYSCPGAYIYFS
ncbi:hypothetical protein QLQ12_43895 [Actinoplanes sp. NEAU-A12]|uniref:Uncharacterized protein n=1 Tax=Actinoplanes sandaracinus TaxID=3045177 RepID=A0ABT6X0R4_9ACTN|nr:hypothetical protein [Actinoplanes sandaracinus]MDI6105547.1 hypothetical protein [Actinoplanes sandaracinus]